MDQLYKAKAVLLIGNDPTNQNPLVAWQIRTGVRHHAQKLYVINSKEIKLERQADQFVQVAEGQEGAAVRWLHNESPLGPQLVEQLTQLKAALDAESDLAIVFGSELSGAAISDLVGFGCLDDPPGRLGAGPPSIISSKNRCNASMRQRPPTPKSKQTSPAC